MQLAEKKHLNAVGARRPKGQVVLPNRVTLPLRTLRPGFSWDYGPGQVVRDHVVASLCQVSVMIRKGMVYVENCGGKMLPVTLQRLVGITTQQPNKLLS